jgi:hypothetical protein
MFIFVKKKNESVLKKIIKRKMFKGTPRASKENERKRKMKEKIHKIKRESSKESCQKNI